MNECILDEWHNSQQNHHGQERKEEPKQEAGSSTGPSGASEWLKKVVEFCPGVIKFTKVPTESCLCE